MIKIEYSLSQVGLNTNYYSNQEHQKLDSNNSLFQILGDNGKGKSFLLHLLTFALKAHLNENHPIDENIRGKVAQLNNTDKFSLSYDIEILLPNNNYSIHCTKEFNEDGKIFRKDISSGIEVIISENRVSEIIEVIFDVPNNIEARLSKVKDDIISDITIFKDKFQDLTERFATNLYEINQVRDTELIYTEQRKIQELQEKIEDFKLKIRNHKETYNALRVQILMNSLLTTYKTFERDKKEYASLSQKLKGKKRPIVTVADLTKIKKYESEKKDLSDAIKTLQNSINSVLSNEKHRPLLSEITNFLEDDYDIIFTYGVEPLITTEETIGAINNFQRSIPDIAKRLIDNEKLDFYHILTALIDIFQSSKTSINNQLGQIIGGDIEKLYDTLVQERDKIEVIDFEAVSNSLNIKLKDYLQKCKEIRTVEKQLDKARKPHILTEEEKKLDSDFSRLKILAENIKKIPSKITQIKADISYYNLVEDKWVEDEKKCESYIQAKLSDPNIRKYKDQPNFGTDIITKEKRQLEDNILVLERKINSHNAIIQDELDKPEGKIPEDIILKLEKTKDVMMNIHQNLSAYVGHIKENLAYNDMSLEKITSIEDFIGELIAESLNNILPLDVKTHKIKSYNYKDQYFYTADSEKLYIDYVSTGLSSASYLMHKIRSRSKPYQLILLDEVGNMSDKSRSLVIEEVRKLQHSEELISLLMASVINESELLIQPI